MRTGHETGKQYLLGGPIIVIKFQVAISSRSSGLTKKKKKILLYFKERC